jgi:hypothetical protein
VPTSGDLINNALLEIGALAQGETPRAEESTFCLSKLNRLLDAWNARKLYVYAQHFVNYTLTPNLSPHTIGPTGTFVVAQRPVSIEGAAIIINTTTPNVTNPLSLRDHDWWANERVKALANQLPSDLYYEPDWPNGSLFLWPVPTTAYGLELDTRTVLSTFPDLVTTFSLPPGYEDAVTFSLAESLIPSFQVPPQIAVSVSSSAMRARALIQGPNSMAPLISTRDYGMPNKGSSNRTNWNYRTGMTTK